MGQPPFNAIWRKLQWAVLNRVEVRAERKGAGVIAEPGENMADPRRIWIRHNRAGLYKRKRFEKGSGVVHGRGPRYAAAMVGGEPAKLVRLIRKEQDWGCIEHL